VFYQEMGALPDAAAQATQRDSDIYDEVADHLLVLDHARGEGAEAVVATYRLIRAPADYRHGGFY
jgi:putative hemolysin